MNEFCNFYVSLRNHSHFGFQNQLLSPLLIIGLNVTCVTRTWLPLLSPRFLHVFLLGLSRLGLSRQGLCRQGLPLGNRLYWGASAGRMSHTPQHVFPWLVIWPNERSGRKPFARSHNRCGDLVYRDMALSTPGTISSPPRQVLHFRLCYRC